MIKYTRSTKRTGRMQHAPQFLCVGQSDGNVDRKMLAFRLDRICRQWMFALSIRTVQNPEARAETKALPRKPAAELLRVRSQMVAMASEAVRTVRSVIADPGVAYRLLKDLGAVPSAIEEHSNWAGLTTAEQLDQYRMKVAMQLGLVALDRHDVFGTELPVLVEELARRVNEEQVKSTNSEKKIEPAAKP